jgi:hypothetical protein
MVELSTTLYLDQVKVGDAAQNTTSIGAKYEVFERVSFDANYRLAQNYMLQLILLIFSTEVNNGSLEYHLMD